MNAIHWSEKDSLWNLFPLIISISFAMDVFVPAIPIMSHFFKTDDSVMQASLYLFMLTVALGQLCVGPLADYFGRRRISIAAALLFFLGSILAAMSQSITTLLFARIIQATGACGTYLLCFVIIRDNFSTQVCARLFSILCGINAMVASTAPVIGGILLDLTGDWHSGFYFLTLLGIIMSFVAYRNIPDYSYSHQQSNANIIQSIKLISANRDFRHYTLVASVSLLGLYLFCALSPGILINQLHLSATEYGFWFGLNALTVFLTNILSARLTHSYPLAKIVHLGLFWMIGACILMISVNVHHLTLLRFMIPMLCLTIGIGLSMGNATALALDDFKQQTGTATAILAACQFGLAGFIGIATAQWHPAPFILAAPILSLSIFILILFRRNNLKALLQSST